MRRAVRQIIPLKGQRMLSAPFASSKIRSAAKEFYISLDHPHKTYRSGEEVSGQVILILSKNVSGILIKLRLAGMIKVRSTTPLRSDKKQNILNHGITLYGDTDNNELALSKGEHRFPFIVKLPKKNIYTSISFGKGEIRYSLIADICDRLEGSVKLLTSEMLVNIVRPINISLLPGSRPKTLTFRNSGKRIHHVNSSNSSVNSSDSLELQPVDGSINGGSTSNDIKIKVEIPSLGYLKGEMISVKVTIHHYKKIVNVNGIFITLIRVCALDMGEDYELQSFRKDLAQSIVPLILDPECSGDYEICSKLKVPADTFPTIVTDLVSFQYYVEVVINMSNSTKVSGLQKSNRLMDDEVIQLGPEDNIYNVDKLKQMKNVLTLTSEIVVGTERKPLSKPRKRINTSNSHHHQHHHQRRIELPANNGNTSESVISEPSISIMHSSISLVQPQQSTFRRSVSTTSSNSASIPPSLPCIPALPLSEVPRTAKEEKHALRLREQALMPSQPFEASSTTATSIRALPLSPPSSSDEVSESPDQPPPYSEVCRTVPLATTTTPPNSSSKSIKSDS